MSESFLSAVADRRAGSNMVAGPCTAFHGCPDPQPFVFELANEGNEDEPWTDTWIDAFAGSSIRGVPGYGVELPPPPLQDEWHPCTDDSDPALRAVLLEDLESVRQHFREPKDLLRWRENTFTCGHVVGFALYESVLHLAFGTLNLEVLKHLFAVAPLAFMQLMGMTNTEEHMGEGATLPLLYSLSLCYRSEVMGERVPIADAKEKRERRLPAVMGWLCETGLMTPVLADLCFPRAAPPTPSPKPTPTQVGQEAGGRRWIIEAVYARKHLPAAALAALQRWERLGLERQRMLTLASFADVVRLPEGLLKLPWPLERVLWIGARDPSSLLIKLSPEVLRLVVGAACGSWWVQQAAAEAVARLRSEV